MGKLIDDATRAKIVEMYEAGVSKQNIQRELDVSQPSIRNILAEAGHPPKQIAPSVPVTEDEIKRIVALRERGITAARIGLMINRAKGTVIRVLIDHAHKLRGYRTEISPETFVKVWQTSESSEEVATRLKMPISRVYQRALAFRAKGVPLKRMMYSGKSYDWDALAEIAEVMLSEEELEIQKMIEQESADTTED